MTRKMHSLLAALILTSFAAEYAPLEGHHFDACYEESVGKKYGNKQFNIEYRFCSAEEGLSFEQIKSNIGTDTELIFDYAKSRGMRGWECVRNGRLEIYNISFETLNQDGRFKQWGNKSPLGVWGLYDPRLDDENTSSIMLTNQGESWNELIFAHELAHYWYDRFCWNRYESDPEKFAEDFEKYYLKHKERSK